MLQVPEAIVVAVSIFIFLMVILCTCLLRSSVKIQLKGRTSSEVHDATPMGQTQQTTLGQTQHISLQDEAAAIF